MFFATLSKVNVPHFCLMYHTMLGPDSKPVSAYKEQCRILDKAFFVDNFRHFCFANYFLIFRAIRAGMLSFDQASLAENVASRKSSTGILPKYAQHWHGLL